MSIANKVGLGLNVFGKTTKRGLVAIGRGTGKGFKHLFAGLKGEDLSTPVPVTKRRRARA